MISSNITVTAAAPSDSEYQNMPRSLVSRAGLGIGSTSRFHVSSRATLVMVVLLGEVFVTSRPTPHSFRLISPLAFA
jgi:hypothetical protein